jgi:hypothetical protein
MATVTAGYVWTSGETVTPAKLNSAAAPTVVVDDAEITNIKLASGIDASKLTTGTLPIARIADAAVTPAKLSQPLTLATAQNTTSGTSIDFTGIPSWVKRITVMLKGVSTSATSQPIIQLGSSTFTTSGYLSAGAFNAGAGGVSYNSLTSGLTLMGGNAASAFHGHVVITSFGSNAWVASGVFYDEAASIYTTGGSVTLAGVLDRLRLTTANGTDTFDAGSVNIMYEG